MIDLISKLLKGFHNCEEKSLDLFRLYSRHPTSAGIFADFLFLVVRMLNMYGIYFDPRPSFHYTSTFIDALSLLVHIWIVGI